MLVQGCKGIQGRAGGFHNPVMSAYVQALISMTTKAVGKWPFSNLSSTEMSVTLFLLISCVRPFLKQIFFFSVDFCLFSNLHSYQAANTLDK